MSDYGDDESKLLRKAKENPFVPAGVAGCLAIVGYRLLRMRTSHGGGGNAKMSVQLIHMRVAAQGFVVGAMTLGVVYSMCRDYLVKPGGEAPKGSTGG